MADEQAAPLAPRPAARPRSRARAAYTGLLGALSAALVLAAIAAAPIRAGFPCGGRAVSERLRGSVRVAHRTLADPRADPDAGADPDLHRPNGLPAGRRRPPVHHDLVCSGVHPGDAQHHPEPEGHQQGDPGRAREAGRELQPVPVQRPGQRHPRLGEGAQRQGPGGRRDHVPRPGLQEPVDRDVGDRRRRSAGPATRSGSRSGTAATPGPSSGTVSRTCRQPPTRSRSPGSTSSGR